MNKKYELIGTICHVNSNCIHRIKALRDFNDVKAGDLGGFIETENNLSHKGNCWVSDSAIVYENARVYGNALVSGYAAVYGHSRIYGNAQISNAAKVSEDARVYGNAWVGGRICIWGDTRVYGDAHISATEYGYIYGNTKLDHGVWTQYIRLNGKYYLLSSTLEKLLVG